MFEFLNREKFIECFDNKFHPFVGVLHFVLEVVVVVGCRVDGAGLEKVVIVGILKRVREIGRGGIRIRVVQVGGSIILESKKLPGVYKKSY